VLGCAPPRAAGQERGVAFSAWGGISDKKMS
jgi:hypothetical protein